LRQLGEKRLDARCHPLDILIIIFIITLLIISLVRELLLRFSHTPLLCMALFELHVRVLFLLLILLLVFLPLMFLGRKTPKLVVRLVLLHQGPRHLEINIPCVETSRQMKKDRRQVKGKLEGCSSRHSPDLDGPPQVAWG